MTVSEVARRLGVCPNTVRAYADRGLLRSVRDAFGWRQVMPDDVVRFQRAYRATRRTRTCRFCSASIPQTRTYCAGDACRRRRQRLRFRAWYARHKGTAA